MKVSSKTVVYFIAIVISCLHTGYALEASFTHAPDKDTGTTEGPLPLSQNQRNQLMQLDQQIAQSPNPTETLQKVAEANGMDASELGNMLMRNRRDMEMGQGGGAPVGGGGVANSLPRQMIRLMSTFVLMGCKSASAHPQKATFIALTLFAIVYITISAPRNGVVISGGSGLISSGHTTMLLPPTAYMSNYVSSDKFRNLKSSMPALKSGKLTNLFSDEDTKDGIHVASLSKAEKKELSQVITAVKSVPFELLLPSEEDLELMLDKEKEENSENMSDDDLMTMLEDRAWEESVDLAFNSVESIIAARRFSEFIAQQPSNSMRFVARGSNKDNAAFALKGLGDWKRYGIQPLRLAKEEQSEDVASVIFYTLKRGHFDGELKIAVQKEDDGDDRTVKITVSLLIPKGGRKMNTKLASKMVSMLADSITTSSMTAARQTLSRKLQSTIYRGKAKSRATEKRQMFFDNIQKMEEMAADRRRRWQRSNQGSGNYRPTGFRGPEGSPAHGF